MPDPLPGPDDAALVHTYEHRVRYRECDPMGVVYHAHYLDYFEAARTEALRALGVAYSTLEAGGILMPVIDARVRYFASAHYDDVLQVEAHLDPAHGARVETHYVVRNAGAGGADAPLAEGQVTLCFVDAERRRPVRAPEQVREAFARALG